MLKLNDILESRKQQMSQFIAEISVSALDRWTVLMWMSCDDHVSIM